MSEWLSAAGPRVVSFRHDDLFAALAGLPLPSRPEKDTRPLTMALEPTHCAIINVLGGKGCAVDENLLDSGKCAPICIVLVDGVEAGRTLFSATLARRSRATMTSKGKGVCPCFCVSKKAALDSVKDQQPRRSVILNPVLSQSDGQTIMAKVKKGSVITFRVLANEDDDAQSADLSLVGEASITVLEESSQQKSPASMEGNATQQRRPSSSLNETRQGQQPLVTDLPLSTQGYVEVIFALNKLKQSNNKISRDDGDMTPTTLLDEHILGSDDDDDFLGVVVDQEEKKEIHPSSKQYLFPTLIEKEDVEAEEAKDAKTEAILPRTSNRHASMAAFTLQAARSFGAEIELLSEMETMLQVIETTGLDFERAELHACADALNSAEEACYVDIAFPPIDEFLLGVVQRRRKWCRVHEIYPAASIFGDEGVSPGDIVQGSLGDCWLCSSMAAIAEFPQLVLRIFPEHQKKDILTAAAACGLYRARLCQGGLWKEVTLDDYFPCSNLRIPLYTQGRRNQIWTMLVEKALAKLSGGYKRLKGGLAHNALVNLTGYPAATRRFAEPDIVRMITSGQLFELLRLADRQNFIVCSATPGFDTFSESKTSGCGNGVLSSSGLVPGHAYSLISVARLGESTRLVRLRNPWAKIKYKGTSWRQHDPRWTPEAKAEIAEKLGITDINSVNDESSGLFWMEYEEYVRNFSRFSVCIPHMPPEATPWSEYRCRGSFDFLDHTKRCDNFELYRLKLSRPSRHLFVTLYQVDDRVRGAAAYTDLALCVLRRQEEDSNQFEHCASTSPNVQRQVVVPDLAECLVTSEVNGWSAGEYIICAWTACSAGLRLPRTSERNEWPDPEHIPRLLRSAISEIFDRYDSGLKRELTPADVTAMRLDQVVCPSDDETDIVTTLFSQQEQVKSGQSDDIQSAIEGTDQSSSIDQQRLLSESSFRDWFLNHHQLPALMQHFGYEPGLSTQEYPALVSRKPIVVAVHCADSEAELEKIDDDDEVYAKSQLLPLLETGEKSLYFDRLELYVLNAAGGCGATIGGKNIGDRAIEIILDASDSQNCVSRTTDGALSITLVLQPNEAKIFLNLAPASSSQDEQWTYQYKVSARILG